MNIFLVILQAIGALVGPFEDAFKALMNEWNAFHANGDTTPADLMVEGASVLAQILPFISDVQTQINTISVALQQSHSNITPAVATAAAAAVVVSAKKA